MPAVSVIMPVYNSEKYVAHAIKSVLSQTFTNFELILIDDGSNDNSGKICDKYAKKDKRIVVIHKDNGGICSARNMGLNIARGEYIAFIDNDDEYLPNLLKDNYSLAKKYDADVVRFNRLRKIYLDNKMIKKDIFGTNGICKENKYKIFEKKELIKNYNLIKSSGALFGIWNGIFKLELLNKNNLRFDESIKFGGEDWILNLKIISISNRYVFNGNIYYIYNRRNGFSTSTKFNENRIEAILECDKLETKILNLYNEEDYLFNKINYLFEILNIYNNKNCKYSLNKKERKIKNIIKLMELKKYINKKIYVNLNIKKKIFVNLIFNDKIKLLILISKIYSQFKRFNY